MSICSIKIKRDEDGSLIKHIARLCPHGVMQKWGVSELETYSPLVIWMQVRAMLTLSIPRDLHIKSVDVFLAYTQEIPICFGFKGSHPI